MRRQSLAVAAFSMIAVLAAALGLLPAPAASKTIFDKNVRVTSPIMNWLNLTCGGEGQSCCKPAFSLPPSLQPMVSCAKDLGCDLTTNKCVQPCGAAGQVCCVGPETNAPKWTSDGRLYSPNSPLSKPMCKRAACDRQTHTCFECGDADGKACCPPDASQATARCIGDRLACSYDPNSFYESGVCFKCGIEGRPPCDVGGCDIPLGVKAGLCARCGQLSQQPCDNNTCAAGLGIRGGLCQACGRLNQPPCDRGCAQGLDLLNGLCKVCGGLNQPPCDSGCRNGTVASGGRCVACGQAGQPACASGCRPGTIANNLGTCVPCGLEGQRPCSNGCSGIGLVVVNGVCRRPVDPPVCARTNEACVPANRPGTQCCQTDGPQVCNFGFCKQCVPSGQVCQLGGPQLCCTAGEVCRLEVPSGEVRCGIPD